MATTITPDSLITTITESISLNGHEYGNEIIKTFATQGKVDQRIMELAPKGDNGDAWTTILALSTADSKGTIIVNDFAYVRLTNLDDTATANIELYNGTDYIYIKIDAGESFLLMSPDIDYLVASGEPTYEDIEQINGQADSGDVVEIEYVIVSA